MRPINKFDIGDNITLLDGRNHIIQVIYKPYQMAKEPLLINMGLMCIYCEASYAYPRELNMEHILPKDPNKGYAHLQFNWSNFLLSCATCNGSDNKGTKVALPNNCHFPHINNTFLSLKYDKGGVVGVNPNLTGLSYDKANNLLKLVGLDKSPKQSCPGDNRWLKRKVEWDMAEKYRERYNNRELTIDCLIDYIKARGCWSIWFTVFEGIDDVRRRMISDFPGTAYQCFDANNHYKPINRNPGQEDPV